MLRILIVDDQKSIRETLKTVLETEPDLEVVATAHDGLNAIELAQKLMPDLMLVDLEMPGIDGLELTRIIERDFPSIKVIVLSMHERDEYIQQSLQSGAMGYFLKNTPAEDLKEAIRLVSRGYTQFSPGLIHKVFPAVETKVVKKIENFSQPQPLTLEPIELYKPAKNKQRRIRKSWKTYLPYWLAGNLAIWGLAILYLIFKSPTYTSKWSVSLPSNQNSSSVSIPDVGSVSSNIESAYRNDLFDPRENYKYLLEKKQILSEAALKVGMKRSEFGEPDVEIVDNTTMMELSMEGDTAQEAQRKASVMQEVLEQKLQELRQGQISQTDSSLQASLTKSQQALNDTRQKLAQFKAETAIGSADRESNLSSNLEDLRRQQAEVKAELQQARAQAQRLADSLGISSQVAKDAFALHSDSLFQNYLSEYTRTSGELVSLESQFQPSNPIVINKREETNAARNALLQRGEVLLGSRPSSELLQQLNLNTGDENDSYRGSLLKDIVSMQSEANGLAARAAELDKQIAQLETKENNLVQQRATLSKLEQDVKFAETVYSSNLAKSRLAESNLYDAYPQIQVAIEPSLPTKPSSPDPILVSLGAFMGSLFLTTAIASLWASSTQTVTIPENSSNNRHREILPEKSLNSLVK
jgi:DNA-binding NarL/FixJ family response regulator/uncharacterized protein involved in exopolysaccharide biosynthesis